MGKFFNSLLFIGGLALAVLGLVNQAIWMVVAGIILVIIATVIYFAVWGRGSNPGYSEGAGDMDFDDGGGSCGSGDLDD